MKVRVETLFHGKVAVRDKFIKACKATGEPAPALDCLQPCDNQTSPRLLNGEAFHNSVTPETESNYFIPNSWGNAKPPSKAELEWIISFGKYENIDINKGRLSTRLSLQVANLKEITRIIVYHHYLHRGRTMAQLGYWILIDRLPIGILLYSFPRLSSSLDGIPPMNLLELARIWISPSVQNKNVHDSAGTLHTFSVASCAVGKSLKRLQRDWYEKYPKLPDVLAIVSWADKEHHEGTIYYASNFKNTGESGGSLHGSRTRNNGGRDQSNADYKNLKTRFLFRFNGPLSDKAKIQLNRESQNPTARS